MLNTFSKQITWIKLLGILLSALGICIRWVYITAGRVPFNSDEAVVGLMARHIIRGERPIFFYGQAYMGSLDAWLNALSFRLFGETMIAMRITQSVLWIILLFCVFTLAKQVFSSSQAGWIAVILTANPVVNVLLYTTITLGGYNEALIIGILCLLVALKIIGEDQSKTTTRILLILFMGFLIGFGLWTFAFAMVFSIPGLFMMIWKWNQRGLKIGEIFYKIGLILAGFLAGSLPWWYYGIQNGLHSLILELTGSAVAVEETTWIVRSGSHFLNFLLLGISVIFGFRPPWSVEWLLLPAIPFILILWVWVVNQANRFTHEKNGILIIWLVIGFNVFSFVALSFGVDPSGRYFLPISILLNILAAGGLFFLKERLRWQVLVLASIMILYPLIGTFISNQRSPAGFTTQFAPNTEPDHQNMEDLIRFLEKNNITRGYTNYWVSYPLAFLSQERLIFTPELPYHRDFRYTNRDNRYDPYKEEVNSTSEIAYIVDQFPELAEKIRVGLSSSGTTWKETIVGGYIVIYDLSSPIRPQSLGIYKQDNVVQ